MANILSQEEVDALLKGISGGEIETDLPAEKGASGVEAYDFGSQDGVVQNRLPVLEITSERFASMFGRTLSRMLGRVAAVRAGSIDTLKYGELVRSLPVPSSMHLFSLDPLRGVALLIADSRMIFLLVDLVFGGSGRSSFRTESREFTPIENGVIRKVVVGALADIERAWLSLMPLRAGYRRFETNPQFVQLVPPADVVVVSHFAVEVESLSGSFSLALPYAMLAPFRDPPQTERCGPESAENKRWTDQFKRGMFASRVDLTARLGSAEIYAGELLGLKRGDVIPLDRSIADAIDLYVEGVRKFRGEPVVCNGNPGVRISDIITGDEVAEHGTE